MNESSCEDVVVFVSDSMQNGGLEEGQEGSRRVKEVFPIRHEQLKCDAPKKARDKRYFCLLVGGFSEMRGSVVWLVSLASDECRWWPLAKAGERQFA